MDYIVKAGADIKLCYSARESDAVKIAITNLQTDLKKIARIRAAAQPINTTSVSVDVYASKNTSLLANANDYGRVKAGDILIGTVGISDQIEQYIDVGRLKDEQGEWRREAYLLKVCNGILVIAGTDRRGTIYGIYEFCEIIGVSPWYWWADVPIKRKDAIRLKEGYEKLDYPSVEYRGVFINDEEELEHWAKLHMGETTIGVNTYEKIFELLLRLKGNYIWPAMHVNSFNMHVENGALADRMGVVVGTSHCDMLMRSNNREWLPWLKRKGYTDVEYDYSIEGRNREILKEYWKESVEQNRDFEVSYTLGMRGIHDSGFETRKLAAGTEEEMLQKKIELLQMIMVDQGKIISDTLKQNPLKLFIPYKEVLKLYDNGLEVPEDITLLWSNDNYGYIRRYPSEKERRRSGGNGIYYHNSYWAPPGRSYLFICSIPLAQTKYELEKAYENGIRKLWVMNVGAMKPLEQEIEFYLRLAWEIGKEGKEIRTADVDEYLSDWIDRNFSGGHGQEAASLLNDFAQITNVCKIENLEEDIFSQTAYGDEGAVRLNQLRKLYIRGNVIYASLPEEEKAAFFQMVLMKIHAAYYTNAMYYFADRSTLCVRQGKMQAAQLYTEYSRSFDDLRRRMLIYYNDKMLEGKWKGMVTPEDFPPPRTAMYPACTPPLFIGGRRMLATCWNDESMLQFVKPGTKWIEIANGGAGSFDFIVEADDWIELSVTKGSIRYEERIMVTVKDCTRERKGRIIVRNITDNTSECIEVEVSEVLGNRKKYCRLSDGNTEINTVNDSVIIIGGNVDGKAAESEYGRVQIVENTPEDGAMSVPADSQQALGWRQIKRLGRGGGNLIEAYETGAVLSYPIYLPEDTECLLEIHRYPSLNSVGRIRVEVAVDEGDPVLVESQSNDEWCGNWASNTMNHVDKLYLKLPYLKTGLHNIRFIAVDRYFAFSRFVLYTQPRKENNLGILNGDQRLLYDDSLREANSIWYGKLTLKPRATIYADIEADRNSLAIKDAIVETDWYADPITLDKLLALGREVYVEKAGDIRIDAFGAYMQTPFAYTRNYTWQYCSSESYGRSGLAMYIREQGLTWRTVEEAPSLNYRMLCEGGSYRIWTLVKFNSRENARISIRIDGKELPGNQLYGKGNLWRYEAEQAWRWVPVATTDIGEGDHTLTLSIFSSRIRFDRIYITRNDISEKEDRPPLDTQWSR